MYLESSNFIVRDLEETDRDNIRAVEESQPWVKSGADIAEHLTDKSEKEIPDFFEGLWSRYIVSDKLWVIERKADVFLGTIAIDIDGEHEAHFYIQVLDDANIDGFGKELLVPVIEKIAGKFSITDFFIDLWNDNDRSRQVYEEAGYEFDGGSLEINM